MRKKRLISLLLSLIMVFSVIAAVPNLISAGTIMPFAVFLENEGRLVFVYNNSSIKDNYLAEHTFDIPLSVNSSADIPWYSIRKSVKKVEFSTTFADYRPITTAYWFYNYENLEEIKGIENLNTSEVTDMRFMFALDTSGDLKDSGKPELDLSTFNTSKVTDMSYMFNRCNYSTKIDVSSFDTSKVTNMSHMFNLCQRVPTLDVSGFITTGVTNMEFMFANCFQLKEINLSSFDTSNVTDMTNMFFGDASLTELNVSGFNTANVTSMEKMFSDMYGIKDLDLSTFVTSSVKSMKEMFAGNYSTSIDISSFDTSNVTDMTDMFRNCIRLTDIYIGDGWKLNNSVSSPFMFHNCNKLTQHGKYTYNPDYVGIGFAKDDSNGRGYMTYLKEEAYGVYNPDTCELTLGYGKYNKCRDYYYPISEDGVTAHSELGWYPNIKSITSVNIEPSFVSFRPTKTDYWFTQMGNLSSISGLQYINMEDVTSSKFMFAQCTKLTELDLTSWNTSNLTYADYMFIYDGALKTILVGNGWDVSNVTSGVDMFVQCTALQGGNGTSYIYSNVDSEYARIDKEGQPGYLTGKMTVSFTGGTDATGTAPASVTEFKGTVITLPANPFTKSGYTFAGWSDGTKTYASGASYTIGGADVVMTATWNKVPTPTTPTPATPSPTTPVTPSPTTTTAPSPTTTTTPSPTTTTAPSPTTPVTPSPEPTKNPNPTTPAPTNAPELSVGDFVNRCYSVALGRDADEGGFDYWVSSLNNGTACGAQVGYGFLFSDEYMNKNTSNEQYVKDLYAMYFGREADENGFNYWVEQLNNNTATRENVMAGFANSEEFFNLCNKYGVVCGTYLVGVPNDMQGGVNCFVARLYKVCLNRLPDQGGQAGWVQKLMRGEATGSSAAYGFIMSAEFTNLGLNDTDYICYMYRAFFGREADEGGLGYWLEQLTAGTATREDIFNGFSGSPEFANLCASYGINV